MTRSVLSRGWVLAVVLGCLVLARPLGAISPWAVMLYGGDLKESILLKPESPAQFGTVGLLWQAGFYARSRTPLEGDRLTALKERPFVSLAVFWGVYYPDQIKPENASQHGRFYPPRDKDPAVVVLTMPDMRPIAHPIPADLSGFAGAWVLTAQEGSSLIGIGFPPRLVTR